MSGFNTKERNNNGEYEITFYTDNHEDFKQVQDLCRELIDHTKPYEPKGEYETACNILLSLEQIVRKSDGWEDSAVEAVHNAVQTAIKCMHERPPQGEWIRKVDDVGFISHICSKCGVENEVEDPSDDKFCFNCGAEMRGGKE